MKSSQLPLQLTSKEFIKLNKIIGGKKNKKEEKLQISLSRYIRTKYPDIIFNSDIASGMKLPIGMATKAAKMRSERGLPDMIILEPKGKYKAMCLELKNKESDVYLKTGEISDSDSKKHVREQRNLLARLSSKGYWADFGFGYDDCIKKIDNYMSLQLN